MDIYVAYNNWNLDIYVAKYFKFLDLIILQT